MLKLAEFATGQQWKNRRHLSWRRFLML